jgi:acyl-CoA thioester hydrolase
MSHGELKKRVRSDYGYILEYRTRWSDNDMYDHMNNNIYNFLQVPASCRVGSRNINVS